MVQDVAGAVTVQVCPVAPWGMLVSVAVTA
jgi:hypothetical protein